MMVDQAPGAGEREDLLGRSRDDFVALAASLGELPFRGKQLYGQVYRKKVFRFEEMSDLPKELRRRLSESFRVDLPSVVRRQESRDGTVKLLLALNDGKCVETVGIPEERRETLCISSQVGCAVDCDFCLTARMGFLRNLGPGEIVGQVLVAIQEGLLRDRGFNLVFMGMGEPLYNYGNVMKAFRLLIDTEGMALSHRKITLSTSGVVPVLERMRYDPVLPNLAISLNATTDSRRDELMPINRKWNLEELLKACWELPLGSQRRITFEYVLLEGVNDSEDDARRLVGIMKGRRAKVNLIPYNPNPGLPFRRPAAERVESFRRILDEADLGVYVRKTRGEDISAACGQLAHVEAAHVGR